MPVKFLKPIQEKSGMQSSQTIKGYYVARLMTNSTSALDHPHQIIIWFSIPST